MLKGWEKFLILKKLFIQLSFFYDNKLLSINVIFFFFFSLMDTDYSLL